MQAKVLRKQWRKWIENRKIIIPEHVVDGLNLIWLSDLVVSGGGTMNREAAALVFPSLYEPFGIVALESFASRVPVIVSDTGGFPEVVQHTRTGIITLVNNSDSVAWGILEVLQNPNYCQWLVDNAYADLEKRFSWPKLGKQTEMVYERVVNERAEIVW